MEIQDVPLDSIVLDPGLNLRDRLDPETIERYGESIGEFPPVAIFEVEDRLLLADGFHRHAAAAAQGRRTLRAEVRVSTYDEALDHAAGANLKHGLPLSRAERRRAVEIKLRLHHELSDRRLADELGTGRDLIARVRRELVAASEIPDSLDRIGADGKVYQGFPKDLKAPESNSEDRASTSSETVSTGPAGQGLPPGVGTGRTAGVPIPPWEDAPSDPKPFAPLPTATGSAPTLDEMLDLMADQLIEIVSWTRAEDFEASYRSAGTASRRRFESTARNLSDRLTELSAA